MKLFQCAVCDQLLFFENDRCTKCDHALAYLPDVSLLVPLEANADGEATGEFVALAPQAKRGRVRVCKNYSAGACNWAFAAEEKEEFCRSCRLSTVIPNLGEAELSEAWRRLEAAKRRLLYTLYGLGLPVESKAENQERGVSFAFMKDDKPDDPGKSPQGDDPGKSPQGGETILILESPGTGKVLTGHSDGLITINVAEADDPFREKMRKQMGEAYRTLLGHFRHEIGHYYWDRLVRDTEHLASFRDKFGDESASYDDAVKRHYESGPPADWPSSFVSAYATMHPWEDFAETWAHYLHMVDTLETARAYGLAVRPALPSPQKELRLSTLRLDFDDFDDLVSAWVPLTLAVNSLNRSMGLNDPYPFVLSKAAIGKLSYVHDLIEQSAASPRRVG